MRLTELPGGGTVCLIAAVEPKPLPVRRFACESGVVVRVAGGHLAGDCLLTAPHLDPARTSARTVNGSAGPPAEYGLICSAQPN